MTRQLPLNQIGNHMDGEIRKLVRLTTLEWERQVIEETPVFSLDNYSEEELASMPMFFKVNGKTVPLKKALLERPTGGTLKGAWQADVSKPYIGEVTNNMEYAEPVCTEQTFRHHGKASSGHAKTLPQGPASLS